MSNDNIFSYIIELEVEQNKLRAENERLAECCTRRGARMQKMFEYILDQEFGLFHPTCTWADICDWFDEDGVPK